MKNIISFASLFFALVSASAEAINISSENSLPPNLCAQLKSIRSPSVLLLTPDRRVTTGPIEIGTIFTEKLVEKDEGFFIPTEYRAIVIPSGYVPDAVVSNTSRTLVKKMRSACPNAAEYSLDFILAGKVLNPGKLAYEPMLQFHNLKDNYAQEASLKFDFLLKGDVVGPMPMLDIDDKKEAEIRNFFLGSSNLLALSIKNEGNQELKINSLKPDRFPLTKIKNTTCIHSSILPGTSCEIHLVKLSDESLQEGKIYSIHIGSNFKLGDLRLEFWAQTKDRLVGGLKF